ncbi:MAG TPA: DegV family protein [Syntrophomonadaceae bacterium]|nr:DegV family protein [Syntrophomonadaceae bacterium]HQE23053.1 DegV family protein [Syntrophomonadaceae bacterium]
MLERIALLTDSACDLPKELIERFRIKVLPLSVIYPEKTYHDRINIQPQEVYERMPDEIPTTSMPTPQEVSNLLEEIRQEGFTHVLALHLSSALSGTFDMVQAMAREFEDLVIKVLDTRTLSIGTGWMVLEAARDIASGLGFTKTIDNIQQLQSRVKVYYVLETLEYLRRGGRIGSVAAMLGQFLHLKPIISVDEEGKYYTYAKARGRKKSIEKLAEIVEHAVQKGPIKLAVMHGGAREEFQRLLERFQQLPNIKELIASDISPALGVHTGPGLLGVCVVEQG